MIYFKYGYFFKDFFWIFLFLRVLFLDFFKKEFLLICDFFFCEFYDVININIVFFLWEISYLVLELSMRECGLEVYFEVILNIMFYYNNNFMVFIV